MSINTAELNQLVDKALEGIDKAEAVMRGLYSQLEDAQGEIRALRATEAGLLERVKELEEGLKPLASYPLEEFSLESKPDNRQLFGANDWRLSVCNVRLARALLEKQQ